MNRIIISVIDTHVPTRGFLGKPTENTVFSSKGKEISRYLTPGEVKMNLANQQAGVSDNLLWHGYTQEYIPEKEEWHFIREQVRE